MPELEKVLKALEHHKETAVCIGCPYAEDIDTAQGYCPIYDDAIALLREQEPMIPIKVRVSTLQEFDGIYKCRSCGHYILLRGQKYCYECGRKVKWDV